MTGSTDPRSRRHSTGTERVPVVFRLAGALLLLAVVGGQVWQRQPGGALTRTVLAIVARHCPSAAVRGRHPTVADGARALDRATYRLLVDRYAPHPTPRCGG